MKRKIFSILFALVLLCSFSLVTAVPAGAQLADGDVAIVVQVGGTPIEGATARLLFYWGGTEKGGYSMDGKSTDATGSATFTAAEIATWLAAEGYTPTGQIYAQPGAKVEADTAYGNVRTVDPVDGFPCIPYNVPGDPLDPVSAMSFTYDMILMSTEPVQTVWDDPSNEFTVTATLAAPLSVVPDETQMRLIRNLVPPQPPAVGGSDDDWYMWNGTAHERWIGIATVEATATGASISANFSQGIFSDWLVGNKTVVRPEFGVNRTVDGVPCIDDYSAVDILRPSSYIHPAQINDTDLFYPTIQDAIDAAVGGDTINVADGTYTEALTITDKALTITGKSEAGVIVQAGVSLTDSINTFTIAAAGKDITIQNMTIRNGDYGIRSSAGNVNVLHCTLYHNGWDGQGLPNPDTAEQAAFVEFWNISGHCTDGGAIRIKVSTGSEVAYCTVYENDRGIRFSDSFSPYIHHCVSHDNVESGIYLSSVHPENPGVDSGIVEYCESYNNMNNGLLDIGGTGNIWRNNDVHDNWTSGVAADYPSEITIQGNTIDNNNIYGFTGEGTQGENIGGVFLSGVADGSFTAKILSNTISNNNRGTGTNAEGIRIKTTVSDDGITIKYNTFTNHDIDIDIDSQAATTVVNYNNFDGTGIGVRNNVTGANVDATKNWWDDPSGPDGDQGFGPEETYTGLLPGSGDSVSANVKCMPWLTKEFQEVLDDDIAYFGVSFPVQKGWNIVSAPLALDAHVMEANLEPIGAAGEYPANTWGGLRNLGKIDTDAGDDYALKLHYTVVEGVRVYSPIYYYVSDPASDDFGTWQEADAFTEINPLDAFYIRMMEPDSFPVLFSPKFSVPSKELYQGWNLVGCAYMDVMFAAEGGQILTTALATIVEVSSDTGDVTGYSQVVSPPVNQLAWIFIPKPSPGTYIVAEPDDLDKGKILMGKGYWVFMENPGTLAGLTFTPISLGLK